MTVLIKQATIIDSSSPFNGQKKDILITDGVIFSIADSINEKADTVIQQVGLSVSIGWMDIFAQFCDPGFEHRPIALDHPIEGRRHPFMDGVTHSALDVFDGPSGIALEPRPIERLGRHAQLHDEIARQVLRLDLAAFFAPKAKQGRLIRAHDDAGVGAADEGTAVSEV